MRVEAEKKSGGIIRTATTVFLAMSLLLLFLSFIDIRLLLVPVLLFVTAAWTYFCWTPVAYEIEEDRLIVFYRIGKKQFSVVSSGAKPSSFPRMPLKLWANGGLFAMAGTFWSRQNGTFYAYLTTTDPEKILEFKDSNGKSIFISPASSD